jgi:hypothetical protein
MMKRELRYRSAGAVGPAISQLLRMYGYIYLRVFLGINLKTILCSASSSGVQSNKVLGGEDKT